MRLFKCKELFHRKSPHISKGTAPDFFSWGFQIYDKWLQLKYNGVSLKPYFEDNRFKRVAIYGMGAIGKRLYSELLSQNIEVRYAIDKNAACLHVDGLTIKTPEEHLEPVDAVIVTPMAFHEIEKKLYLKTGNSTNIIFIEDVVDYCISFMHGKGNHE